MQDPVGRTIGNYQVIERLGAGGMASVYRGFQASLKRSVAIKFLPPSLAIDPTFRERFLREATMVASLQHPNILPVYDFGQRRDLYYIVMMLVTGGTLRDRIGSLPIPITVRLCAQIADALGYAHGQNIVHRDVKPTNVLMARDDWALLADFGIARLTEAVGLTSVGTGIGTPEYMSPEQAMGRAVDGRSDIYSLGIMLFEMCTGQLPFRGDPYSLMRAQVQDSLPRASELNPDVPPEVEAIIDRATQKDPAERYQTGVEMRTALELLIATPATGFPTVSPPTIGDSQLRTTNKSQTPVSVPTAQSLGNSAPADPNATIVADASAVSGEVPVADPSATVVAGVPELGDQAQIVDPSATIVASISSPSDQTQVADPNATIVASISSPPDQTQVADPNATIVAKSGDLLSGPGSTIVAEPSTLVADLDSASQAGATPAAARKARRTNVILAGVVAVGLLCACGAGLSVLGLGAAFSGGDSSAKKTSSATPTSSQGTATAGDSEATATSAPAPAATSNAPTPAPPTATPAPTAIPVGPLIFQDDMRANGNGWDTRNTNRVKMYFGGGTYHIENTDTDTGWVSFPRNRTAKYASFVYEVDFTKVDGPDENYYGITFRDVDIDGYTFAISGRGEFQLIRYVESLYKAGQGGLDTLIEPIQHDAIQLGNTINRLKVIARGPEITMYINDALVGEFVEDNEAARKDGTIGLFAGPGVHVTVSAVRLFQAGS